MRLHFSIGGYDCRRTTRLRHGFHFSRIQFLLLIKCIDAPESTTNYLSSGLIFDGASKHKFSEGEKNAALFFSFNFNTLLASLHAASRAHRSCHSLFLRPILKFWSIGVTLMRFTWANHSERWILVSNVSVTYNGFCEFYTSKFPCV